VSAKHILILDYLHAYNDRRMVTQAAALVRLGYQLSVFVTHRVGKHAPQETRDGATYHLLPLIPARDAGTLLRALGRWLRDDRRNPLPVPEQDPPLSSSLVALLFYTLWALRVGLALKIDAVYCHEHTPMPAAWLLARLKRVPLVYDEHDNREYLRIYGRSGRIAERFELLYLPRVDAVTTIGERLAAKLRTDGARDVVVVGSWKRLEEYAIPEERLTAERERLGLGRYKLVINFIATLHPIRDVEPLLQAVERSPEVALLVGGSGVLAERVQEYAARCPNIIWLGWVNSSEIPLYTHLSDVVYNCLQPVEYDTYLMPNKLFDALAAGKAMLIRDGASEMADVVRREDCGLLLSEVTPEILINAFSQLQQPETLARLQANALAAGHERYNWAVAERNLAALFERVLTNR
jgi:glycosyltransferase involved in cell wall biosynthesis